jgi:hypothetical protein
MVLSDTGLLLMDNIRNVVEQMRSEENRLDAERAFHYEKSVATTILCVYLASAIAALGLILLAYYILREMEIRRKHAAQLLEREEWCRSVGRPSAKVGCVESFRSCKYRHRELRKHTRHLLHTETSTRNYDFYLHVDNLRRTFFNLDLKNAYDANEHQRQTIKDDEWAMVPHCFLSLTPEVHYRM